MNSQALTLIAAALTSSGAAHAQLSIPWWTIDSGGGISAGGSFILSGTIGQPDAEAIAGGTLSLRGGFWAGFAEGACYPNCDQSTVAPVLNVADFTCFLQMFAAGDPYANCDQSTAQPVLNVADFTCFLQRFAGGCN